MNKERLLALADHLEFGNLGHEKFDFKIFNNSNGPECGTLGCAIGECPILWPRDWCFDFEGDPVLSEGDHMVPMECAMEWFDIRRSMAHHLFNPTDQSSDYGGRYLDPNATKEQVAGNIRAFVAKMEQEAAK
jgi:hypothetical protein